MAGRTTYLIIGVLVLVVAGSAAVYFLSSGAPGYNVLLITLDTTRADRLGCYGYTQGKSPFIDRLAREGVRFDFAIAQAAVTPVSHASIFTGLNPYQHGVRVIHGKAGYYLPEEVPTLTSVLKREGYETAAFVSSFPVSEYYGFQRDFDVFETGLDEQSQSKVKLDDEGFFDTRIGETQRRADAVSKSALRWLDRNTSPFFLWLHYFDPHDPALLPPKSIRERFKQGEAMSPTWLRSMYDAEVFFMDREIGRVIRQLELEDLLDETIIVVVGDHGEGLGDHNWWHHRILYQEQIRLPLIVRMPDGPAGREVPDLVRSIDIFPTILEKLGIPAPGGVEGKSLMGLMEGRSEAPRFAYADAINLLDNNRGASMNEANMDLLYCIMNDTWKLVYRQVAPDKSELYNLKEDPWEKLNVIDSHPEEYKRLKAQLEQTGGMIKELIEAAPENKAALEKLKALGYL